MEYGNIELFLDSKSDQYQSDPYSSLGTNCINGNNGLYLMNHHFVGANES